MSLTEAAPSDGLDSLRAWVLTHSPAELEQLALRLDGEDLDVLERVVAEVAATHWRSDPARMAHHLTKGKVKLWAYSLLLARQYRKAVIGESKRQAWLLPARTGKTLWAGVWGPVWALDLDPRFRLMDVEYSDQLVKASARQARDLLAEHQGELRTSLRPDQRAAGAWATPEGGGLYAAGIDGTIAGLPADGIYLGDMYKNWQEAHSAARRLHVMNVYRSVIRLRLESEAGFIIIAAHRVHPDDLTGTLLAEMGEGGETWEVVRLPAIAEAPRDDPGAPWWLRLPDPLGRQPGEVIEAERLSVAEVRARHVTLGPYLVAALEQQDPQPEEGGEIKREWWKLESQPITEADAWCSSTDVKLKEKRAGDYVVLQVWGRVGSHAWCVAQLRGQWTIAETKAAIALAWVRYPQVSRHLIENTGNGPEVMEQLDAANPTYVVPDDLAGELGMTAHEREVVQAIIRAGMPGLIPKNPKGDKTARVRAVAGWLQAGNVHLAPESAPWVQVLVGEAASFPSAGVHDDCVDAFTQAVSDLLGVPDVSSFAGAAEAQPMPAVVPGGPSVATPVHAGMPAMPSVRPAGL